MNRLVAFLLAVACMAIEPGTIGATPGQAQAAGDSTVSQAVTKEVIDAVATELLRSMRLRVSDALRPYFIGYKLTEVEVNDATASLGSAAVKRDRHFMLLESHVHVGDYKFDNSNFVAARRENIDGITNTTLPLEATPALARRAAWLATDAAYKEALEQMRAKQDAMSSGASGSQRGVPSYTSAEPINSPEAVVVPKIKTSEELTERAEKISAVFRDKPHIRDSRVSFTSFLERRWYLNSEGARAHDTRRVAGVIIVASAQAEQDGQELNLYYVRYGITEADLPNDKQLRKAAETLISQLEELRKAPLVDDYVGPVLFEGEGAVGIVRHTLSGNLSGTPLPVGLSDQDTKRFGGELVNLIGRLVLSPMLSVVDDPTATQVNKQSVIGSYKFDDEGVKAQRVEVIKDGKLKELLMSRTPSKNISKSNGHARLSMPGGVFRGSSTNLQISSRQKKSRSALRKQLVKQAQAMGLDYAIAIRQFDDAAITANSDLSRAELVQLLRSMDQDAPPAATLAYKVFPNGKQQLVRGVQLREVNMDKWDRVIGASKEITVKNFLNSSDEWALQRLRGGDEGFVPSAGIENSIATPDLLFDKLSIRQSTAGTRAEPLVPAP